MASNTALIERFRRLPIFAACSDEELRRIDQLADEATVPAGRAITEQGEIGNEFLVIRSGTADVLRDGELIAQLGPGDFFGELALLDGFVRQATVVATSELTMEVIDRRGFATLLEDVPSLSRAMLRTLAHRLHEQAHEIDVLRGRA